MPYRLHLSVALGTERYPFAHASDGPRAGKSDSRTRMPLMTGPPTEPDQWLINKPIHLVQPMFTFEFWDTMIPAYGLSALKMQAAHHPMKARIPMHENRISHFWSFYAGIEGSMKELELMLNELETKGFPIAANYLVALMGERARFNIAAHRWAKHEAAYRARAVGMQKKIVEVRCLCLEAYTVSQFNLMQATGVRDWEITQRLTPTLEKWAEAARLYPGGTVPAESEHMAAAVGNIVAFIQAARGAFGTVWRRILSRLPDILNFFNWEVAFFENVIFDMYSMKDTSRAKMSERFGSPWYGALGNMLVVVRSLIVQLGVAQKHYPLLPEWLTRFVETSHRISLLRRYLVVDQKKLNPVEWRKLLSTLGRAKACRQTHSKNWARFVNSSMAKMTTELKTRFENTVQSLLGVGSSQHPHYAFQKFQNTGLPVLDPKVLTGPFSDLVKVMQQDNDEVVVNVAMDMIQEGTLNPLDPNSIAGRIEAIEQEVRRRRATAVDLQNIINKIEDIYALQKDNQDLYETEMTLQEAQRLRAGLLSQLDELERWHLESHLVDDQQKVHKGFNETKKLLEDQYKAISEAEERREILQRAAEAVLSPEQQALATQKLMQDLLRKQQEAATMPAGNVPHTAWPAQDPNVFTPWGDHHPTSILTSADWDLRDTKLQEARERLLKKRKDRDSDISLLDPNEFVLPPRKKRQTNLQSASLASLIQRPPSLRRPIGIANDPHPFATHNQRRAPFGGPPRCDQPLETHGDTPEDVVMAMVNEVENYPLRGLGETYLLPSNARESLIEVARRRLSPKKKTNKRRRP